MKLEGLSKGRSCPVRVWGTCGGREKRTVAGSLQRAGASLPSRHVTCLETQAP